MTNNDLGWIDDLLDQPEDPDLKEAAIARAQALANSTGEQQTILKSEEGYWSVPTIQWMAADGHVKGIDYQFVQSVDPRKEV
jgi:hypothetical protein